MTPLDMRINQRKTLRQRPVVIPAILVSLCLSICGFATLHAAPAEKSPSPPKPAIELGTPFADHAILQRAMPIPVWGWSKPGTEVTVEFAGQKKSATAESDGKWMLDLDALEASAEPREMTIREKSGAIRTLKDILVGEVWLASGQSNMQLVVSRTNCTKLIESLQKAAEANGCKTVPIRECAVTDFYACLHPIEHATGAWKDGNYDDYSAIAFAFAHKLYLELGVPIGILNCSFSQTSIQAWTPRIGFANADEAYTKAIYQKILESDPSTPEHKVAWGKFYQDIDNTLAENKLLVAKDKPAKDISTKTPGNVSDNRDPSWLFNARLNPMIPYAIKGGIWNQGYANMGEGIFYYNNLHSLIRGWRKLWNRPELPVYFNQFYCPGNETGGEIVPSIDSTAEMRYGTWLARDIPHTGMASQIDIQGAIHYRHKATPGQRLALHALKNQYGKKIEVDGPMFKSYTVKDDQLTVTFEHADGGLVTAETGTNAIGKAPEATGFAAPKIIPNGEGQVKLFYLAGEDRVWHPADVKIAGDKVIVSSAAVKSPRGVSYGTGGIGFRPNLYNQALLPTTPFIAYDNKPVTSKDWPDDPMKVAGIKPDPMAVGLLYEYRKMPLLSTQFRDNAVLQADAPVTIWGSAIHDFGYEAKGKAEIHFSFAGTEKTFPVTPGMLEWSVTLPPMKASSEPKVLKVTFTINGELAHDSTCKNIVIGDVWYIAAPALALKIAKTEKPAGIVRMMTRKAKSSSFHSPRRFSVATSTTPDNRFASVWEDASGVVAELAQHLAAGSDRPVGVIFMQTIKDKGTDETDATLKEWIAADCLKMAPSLMADYKQLASTRPGNDYFDANVHRYVSSWKKYWSEYVPEMIATKRVPDGVPWGKILSLDGSITTAASQTHNVLVESFTPASLKGILFLTGSEMVARDQGVLFGEQMSALANCMKKEFGGTDTLFLYTIPSTSLASKITKPAGIKGRSEALEITDWSDGIAIMKKIDNGVKKSTQ